MGHEARTKSLGFDFLEDTRRSVKVTVSPAKPGAGFQSTSQMWVYDQPGVLEGVLSVLVDDANPADRPLNVEGMYCVSVYAGCFDGHKSLVEVKTSIPHTWPRTETRWTGNSVRTSPTG